MSNNGNNELKAQALAKKSYKKEAIIALINLALAASSIFLFQDWIDLVSTLEPRQMYLNFAGVAMVGVTLFIAVTFYGRGLGNNIKRALVTFGSAAIAVTLLYFAVETEADMVYPAGGLALVFIAFYMLSLSTDTLNLSGIIALTMAIATAILLAKKFGYLADWGEVGTASKWGMFIILFWGGVWPHLRSFAHGIKGVNKDGGYGDGNDGDGDTGDE